MHYNKNVPYNNMLFTHNELIRFKLKDMYKE